MASLKMSRIFAILCAFVAESVKIVGFYVGNNITIIVAYFLQIIATIGIMRFTHLIKEEEKIEKEDENNENKSF